MIILVLPEEIVPTEEFSFSRKTLIREGSVTIEAPDTIRVPCPFQYVQQEFIQDGFVAACTCYQHPGSWFTPTCNTQNIQLHPQAECPHL